MRHLSDSILIVSLLLTFNACSTVNVPITVTHPPELNMSSFKQIAIGHIDGRVGPNFSDNLKYRLVHAKTYQILDRNQVNDLLREHEISNSDLANPGKRLKLGKFMSASVLIGGRADENYKEDIKTRDIECKDKDGKKYPCTSYTRTGTITLSGSIDVTNVETGHIMTTKLLATECSDSSYATDSQPSAIDKNKISAECLNKNIEMVFRTVSPWSETIKVRFKKEKSLPELENGINMAKLGDLERAIQMFIKAVQTAEANASIAPKAKAEAYWNLGLAYEYTHQFDKASDSFEKGLNYSPDSRFIEEKKNVDKMRREQAQLKEQMSGSP